MNPALQRELDRLGATLAARRGTPLGVEPKAVPIPPVPDPEVVYRQNLPKSVQETTASFSARQVARVAADLNPLARRIFALVHLLGCEHARVRGYHPNCAQLTFFCPAELVYAHLGLTRGSFYRSLRELKALGLVDVRGHKTTVNGWQVRCDGSLWCVKLIPNAGRAARLEYDDLRAKYRDLGADISSGRTVWEAVRQSTKNKEKGVTFEELLHWTLSPDTQKNPVTLTVASGEHWGLEQLLDLPLQPRGKRGTAVDRAARTVAAHLGDAHLGFYRYLLWQLLRLRDTGHDHLYAVYGMVIRAGHDRQEGFAKKAGALLVARLKASGLWAALNGAPRYRVG